MMLLTKLISKTVHILDIIKFLQNSDTFKQKKFSFLDEMSYKSLL